MPSPTAIEEMFEFNFVGDGFSAKTATLLSLCDISPNRQCRQLKKIRKNNAQIRQRKLVQKAN